MCLLNNLNSFIYDVGARRRRGREAAKAAMAAAEMLSDKKTLKRFKHTFCISLTPNNNVFGCETGKERTVYVIFFIQMLMVCPLASCWCSRSRGICEELRVVMATHI